MRAGDGVRVADHRACSWEVAGRSGCRHKGDGRRKRGGVTGGLGTCGAVGGGWSAGGVEEGDRSWVSAACGLELGASAGVSNSGSCTYNCEHVVCFRKPPVIGSSGSVKSSSARLKVVQLAGIAHTWKDTRREIGSVAAGTMVEVLEDTIIVDAPDIVRVTEPIAELNLKEGHTIPRFARGEGLADFWAEGCWYKDADGDFIVEPDGGGCGGSSCSARVTKMGRQAWWFRIMLPSGKQAGRSGRIWNWREGGRRGDFLGESRSLTG